MKKSIVIFAFSFFGLMAFFTLTSFKSDVKLKASNSVSVKTDQPEEVTITLSRPVAGVRHFTMTGAINATGVWVMIPTFRGKAAAFYCINRFTATDGSVLEAISHCNSMTMDGVWQVTSGTGIFSGVKGNGRLVMSPVTGVSEFWEGSFR